MSVCVCIGGGGVCACEHTNALRSRVWLQPKRTVYKVQIKNNREDPPPGAQATSGFVLSLSFPDIQADDARSPHSCAWIQGNPLKDFWGKSGKGNSQANHASKPSQLRWSDGGFRMEYERASGRAGREGRAGESWEDCWGAEG